MRQAGLNIVSRDYATAVDPKVSWGVGERGGIIAVMNDRGFLRPLGRMGLILSVVVMGLCPALMAWKLRASAQPAATVGGVVVDADGPVVGAIVRQRTTPNATISEADGTFVLGSLPEGVTATITAWHQGYLVGWAVKRQLEVDIGDN